MTEVAVPQARATGAWRLRGRRTISPHPRCTPIKGQALLTTTRPLNHGLRFSI